MPPLTRPTPVCFIHRGPLSTFANWTRHECRESKSRLGISSFAGANGIHSLRQPRLDSLVATMRRSLCKWHVVNAKTR